MSRENSRKADEIVELVKRVKDQKLRKKRNTADDEAALENIRARKRFVPKRIKAQPIKISF